MPKPINNIGYLLEDLRRNGWHMTAFDFNYKGSHYIVLFENNENIETRKNAYASIVLTFIDSEIPLRRYAVEANQVMMFFNPKEFREFFHIEYTNNLGDLFKQFFNRFTLFVPRTAPKELDSRKNLEIDRTLAGRGGHSPDAIYCYDARRLGQRNGRQMVRSIFISNLTARRRPELFKQFRNEPTVTFYYSPKESDELSDVKILENFARRENDHRNNSNYI